MQASYYLRAVSCATLPTGSRGPLGSGGWGMVAHRPVVAVMAGTLMPSGVHRWIGRGHRHPQAAFVEAWRRRYKAAPDPYAAEAYDSVRMLLSEFARTVPA